jgi:outer membrane protein assembly factor BamB
MVMTVDDTKLIIGQVSDGIVAINAADGKHVWEIYFEGGGSRYKAATPIVSGDTLIYLDGPAAALKLSKEGEKFVSKDLWKNADSRVEYNTPVLKDGLLFGISQRGELFCVNTKDGKTAWTAPLAPAAAAPPPAQGNQDKRGKGRRGGGGGGGYGSVVDAGSVLFALTPSAQLVVFEPTDAQFKQLASYKVADRETHAYPIVTDNRIYVKDRDSVTLWTIE